MSTPTNEERADMIAMIEGDPNLPDEIKARIVATYKGIATIEEKAGIKSLIIAAMTEEMTESMHKSGNAERIANGAYKWFWSKHHKYADGGMSVEPLSVAFYKAIEPIATAADTVRTGINAMPRYADCILRQAFHDRGVNLDVLRLALQVFAEVAADTAADADADAANFVPLVRDEKITGGSVTINAAIRTVEYLMRYKLKRQKASKIVAALLCTDPDVPSEHKKDFKKTFRNIEQAARNAGI